MRSTLGLTFLLTACGTGSVQVPETTNTNPPPGTQQPTLTAAPSEGIKTVVDCIGQYPMAHYRAAIYTSGDKLVAASYKSTDGMTTFYAAGDASADAAAMRIENEQIAYNLRADGVTLVCQCVIAGCDRYNDASGHGIVGPDTWTITCTRSDY